MPDPGCCCNVQQSPGAAIQYSDKVEDTMRLNPRKAFHFLGLVILAALPAQAQKTLTPIEAKDHIGESATVCGEVASTRYASRTRGSPTFMNLAKPYPNQVFTALIWGTDRPKFGEPEELTAVSESA
jgi:hypothetical protein